MSNLKIAPPQVNHDSPVSAKGLGKTKTEGAQDFEAKLKQGLAEQAKEEENKKAPSPIANSASLTGIAQVPAQEQASTQSSLVDPNAKDAKPKSTPISDKLELTGKDEKEKNEKLRGEEASEEKSKLGTLGIANPILEKSGLKPAVDAKNVKLMPANQAQATVQKAAMSRGDVLQAQVQADASATLEKSLQDPSGAGVKIDPSQLQALQGQAVSGADGTFDHDFDLESLEVKGADGMVHSSKTSETGVDSKNAPVSKLSTTDYLSLRDLAKKEKDPEFGAKKGKLEIVNAKEAAPMGSGLTQATGSNSNQTRVMEATVTTGASGNRVLSPESTQHVTNTVNLMSQAKQDGEIKIRLRPDHLGELQMSVKTHGNQVAIQIKAQSSEAKKMIEDSLSALKDSFAKQNLSLAQIDVITASNATQTQDQGMQMDFSGSRQNFGQEARNFDQGQSSRQDRLYEDAFGSSNLNAAPAPRARYASSGRDGLDLIA